MVFSNLFSYFLLFTRFLRLLNFLCLLKFLQLLLNRLKFILTLLKIFIYLVDKFHSSASILLSLIIAFYLRLTRQKLVDLVDLHLLRLIQEVLRLCCVFSYIIPLELILLTLLQESLILIENDWQMIRTFLQSCTMLIVTYYHVLNTGRTINRKSTYFKRVIRCFLFATTFLSFLFLPLVTSIDFIDCHTIWALFGNNHRTILDSLIFDIKVTFVVQQAKINRILISVIVVREVFI